MTGRWAVATGVVLCGFGAAYAANITIPDEAFTDPSGWYGPQEDQEVEFRSLASQLFDLEGFFLEGTALTVVGGYNYVRGAAGLLDSLPGDIFIDINGDAKYGAGPNTPTPYPPYTSTSDNFGYDFVIDLDFSTLTFEVFNITDMSALVLDNTDQWSGQGANPWRYQSGGAYIGNGDIAFTAKLTDTEAQEQGFDVTGGRHHVATMDISWLIPYASGDFMLHFTTERGYDLLMGSSRFVAPEPGTLLLVGAGLAGAYFRRRVFRG